jgi:hypothetical protein
MGGQVLPIIDSCHMSVFWTTAGSDFRLAGMCGQVSSAKLCI